MVKVLVNIDYYVEIPALSPTMRRTFCKLAKFLSSPELMRTFLYSPLPR